MGNADGYTDVGTAAHITAASSGGPRYDPLLTPQERKSAANGIWCCAIHGRQIDSDNRDFTVEKLLGWKRRAEEASYQAIATLERPPGGPLAALDDAEAEFVRRLGLQPGDTLVVTTGRARGMAGNDLRALKRGLNTPEHPLALNFRMLDGGDESFQVDGLALSISTFTEMAIVAPPGTGKTTSMILTADAMLRRPDLVPLFVPLGEWSAQSLTLFDSILRRSAFAGLTEAHLRLLAVHGRLVLLLDGWNELEPSARRRLQAELKTLRRDFAQLGVIISTRRQALDVPLSGPTIEIQPLNQAQQLQIAQTIRGETGSSLLDQAWRTPGVRELVTIPLYVTALLGRAQGARLPETKEEVLRLFIEQHERVPEKADALRGITHSRQADYLTAIAVAATRADSVSLTEAHARHVIAGASRALIGQGQISEAPQPQVILDALVSHHLLVRAGDGAALSFQHQQFQEFYAAAHVEALMRAVAAGEDRARKMLRVDILNRYSWEEAILFACERCSRTPDGIAGVAAAVRESLTIDPMLAAEIIFRATDALWQLVSADVVTFATQWHKRGQTDRAFRFMVKTGRAEFVTQVWPLVSDTDDQVHLGALRSAGRFRVSVLGPNRERELRQLPVALRRNVLSELVMNGGYEGIELSATIAESDDSSDVRASVIEALLFRRATNHADRVLQTSPDEVWQRISARSREDDLVREMRSAQRLEETWNATVAATTDARRRLSLLIRGRRRGDDAEVQRLIEDPTLTIRPLNTDDQIDSLLFEIRRRFPQALQGGLITRAIQGLPLPFRAAEYLSGRDTWTDEGPLAAIVLEAGTEEDRAMFAVRLIGAATVSRLIDQALDLDARWQEAADADKGALYERLRREKDLISASCGVPFVNAVLMRAGTQNLREITLIADLIGRHGRHSYESSLQVPEGLHARLVETMCGFADVLLVTAQTRRSQMAELAEAMGRVGAAEFVAPLRRMLAADMAGWRRQLDEAQVARAAGRRPPNDASMSFQTQYRRAFVALRTEDVDRAMVEMLPQLGRHEFGESAAYVLLERWLKKNRPEGREFRGSMAQFAEIPERRAERLALTMGTPVGDAIFRVAEDCSQQGVGSAAQMHALKLVKVAVTMPYLNRDGFITSLLELRVVYSAKLDLLTALARAGETLPASVVLACIQALLVDAETQPWLLHDQHAAIHRWLPLLAFTDRPVALLDVLNRLPGEAGTPWRIEEAVSALGYAQTEETERVLRELAERDPRFFADHTWIAALKRHQSMSSLEFILDSLAAARFPSAHALDPWHFGRELAARMERDGGLRALIYKRFERASVGVERDVLKEAIAESADEAGILLLVRVAAERGEPFDGGLGRALERVAIARRPAEGWHGAFELEGQPIPRLRSQLFDLVRRGAAVGELASRCLTAIDELRDEHGSVLVEPRHPDIGAELPWPRVMD